MMTSALDLLRRGRPGARIAVLARPEARSLLSGNPVVDELVIYPYKSGSPFHGLAELRRRIKAGRHDVFLSLDRRPRGAAAAFIAGIPRRIGPDILFAGAGPKLWTRLLFNQTVTMSPDECRGSLVEMFQLVVRRAFGLEGRGRISLPPVDEARARWARGLLAEARGPVVGLCVRTNDPGKTWPAEGFAALARRLKYDFNAFIYVTGSPADRPYVEALAQAVRPLELLNLAGRTELMDINALAAQSDLCVALDNGAAHLMANSPLKRLLCLLMATTPAILMDSMPRARFISFPPPPPGQAATLGPGQVETVYQAAAELLRQAPPAV
ncbi:MAG: glycosyltransferase family 9 protein [Candidatus Adiutrix sp.]|nr:glycosyltransferase family 9 protein [Candidatus Adiutrix sp.]